MYLLEEVSDHVIIVALEQAVETLLMNVVEREIVGDVREWTLTQHLYLTNTAVLVHCQTEVASFRTSHQVPAVLKIQNGT